MAIIIGHASISEKGTVNGAKGDQTGKEVCTRTWYSKPWHFVAIHKDAAVREKIAKAVEQACANNYIGYGQSDRNSLNTLAKPLKYDLSKVSTKCNADCSSLINVAVVAAGAAGATYGSNGWTTATMERNLSALGFAIIKDSQYLTSSSYCVRGAIYNRASSHVVCGLDNGSNASKLLAAAGASKDSAPTQPSVPTGDLSVDGIWGVATTSKLQSVLGTEVDGVVSNQRDAYLSNLRAISYTSWKFKATGSSPMIEALQALIGTKKDGIFGPTSVYMLQRFLNLNAGADLSEDKIMGPLTVKALQKYLNSK